MGILVHVFTAVVMFMFARNLGLPLTLLDCLLFMPPIMLLAAVPISIAGWGVREGVVVGSAVDDRHRDGAGAGLVGSDGFTMLANGVIGVLPLMFGGQRYWAGRTSHLLVDSEM